MKSYPEIQTIPYGEVQYPKEGRVALIRNEKSESILTALNKDKIEAISLNCSRGWLGEDVSFLSELKFVRCLSITTSEIKNLNAIENMESLEHVQLTSCPSEPVDFTKLTKLNTCYLYWWKGALSIFSCTWLNELYLDGAKLKDFSGLGNLVNLEKLVIANSNIKSLDWLPNLTKLKELDLTNCKGLEDFSSISQLHNLNKLVIEGCKKLENIKFVKNLDYLEWLDLSANGNIASLSGLSGANNLKILFFTGSTIIEDGDLSYLENLPNLSVLNFTGKRSYSHKLIKKWSWDNLDKPSILLKAK